jgi:hypothetical protein
MGVTVRTLGIAWLMVCAGACSARGAQNCDDLDPEKGPLGYALRHGSDRCEGLYQERVGGGGGGLDLVSLTYGRLPRPAGESAILEIRADAAPDGAPPLQILGTAIPARLYYRLAAPFSTAPFELPLSAVLAPAQISVDQIGFYGLRSLPGARPGYVPLHVSVKGGNPGGETDLLAILRARADIDDIRWRVRDRTVSAVPGYTPLQDSSMVSGGDKFEIRFPRPPGAGPFVLEILYRTLKDGQHDPVPFDLMPR